MTVGVFDFDVLRQKSPAVRVEPLLDLFAPNIPLREICLRGAHQDAPFLAIGGDGDDEILAVFGRNSFLDRDKH